MVHVLHAPGMSVCFWWRSLQLLKHRMLPTSLSLFFRDVPVMSTVAGIPSVLTTMLLLASLLLLLVRVDPGTPAVLLVSLRLLTVAGVPSVLTTLLLLASLLLLLVRDAPGGTFDAAGLLSIANCWWLTISCLHPCYC
jgi:hypothetical protein